MSFGIFVSFQLVCAIFMPFQFHTHVNMQFHTNVDVLFHLDMLWLFQKINKGANMSMQKVST
jgi:hypothetical protein